MKKGLQHKKRLHKQDNMIDNYVLYNNIPSIDLHGEDRIGAIIKANEFINENYKLKNSLIKIIHGKGKGILKQAIQNELKNNKYVKDYRIDIFNEGTTIIELKKD